MKFINENINDYCDSVSESDSCFLKDLKTYTNENEELPQMISGNMVGNILQVLIKSLKAKRILEIGTFTGFSSIKMAEGNSECTVDTCELMDKHVKTARKFISKANLKKQIFVHHGPALNTLETFKVNTFDLAFIDADKINYLEYYRRCMALVKKNGIIVLDNMLWSGEVINPKDDNSMILNKTAKFINQDDRVFNVLMPIRDGLMVCYKK